VPELANNQVLVRVSDSSRVRIEPTPKFIVLETWTLECSPHRAGYDDHFSHSNMDTALPIIYKHGIILFRSVYSLLRILPTWKFRKRLGRRTAGVNRCGNFSILLRVRPSLDGGNDRHILGFSEYLSKISFRSSVLSDICLKILPPPSTLSLSRRLPTPFRPSHTS
jgi:autophagy-related protein 13